MEETVWSLIPPVLALLLVILTRRVLVSLGAGIVAGALIINDFQIGESLSQIAGIVRDLFYVDGAINDWEFYILLFLLLLGMMAALISLSGGSAAFGEWAMKRVKTRIGAQLVTIWIGIIIFIDDYFNSLTVGNIARPLTDRHRVSRAKLAYLIDSTAAPICVIAPVSSWGAYIITVIAGILTTHAVTDYGALQAFMLMVPMNFYAILAILMVLGVAWYRLDFGAMKKHEQRAVESGQLVDPDKGKVPGDHREEGSDDGNVGGLLWPILALIAGTVSSMVWTGATATEGAVTLLSIFENTDVAVSLLYGGLLGLTVSLVQNLLLRRSAPRLLSSLWAGIRSMLPAIYILIFAWTIISIISDLGTGTYLAGLVDAHIPVALLPALLFIISGFMAFTTGTSWGTFGIMLPIAGEIAAVTEPALMLPVLAAVLAGAIFGDHCSPISDTTILSSTGAGSHHIDHVMTQLPYALIVAGITLIGYLVLGFVGNVWIALLACLLVLGAVMVVMRKTICAP
ncbi:Na+/H+ antiporter NhaC family protein [Desmospora profundinema]|uniref:Tetracycline resistance efflux pump n=1 Tax=Desmospora profundinema TaxID=1571184 RepID=A0ABU1ILC1_9BACL|nr:Na+/H+ antiporter NhaC family protein [Desmospora profundinema]MDR6225568.1 tetracycline resistance efflux pump [Desmospora profundinema]